MRSLTHGNTVANTKRDLRKASRALSDLLTPLLKKYNKTDLHSWLINEVCDQIRTKPSGKPLSKKDQAAKDKRTAESKAALLGCVL